MNSKEAVENAFKFLDLSGKMTIKDMQKAADRLVEEIRKREQAHGHCIDADIHLYKVREKANDPLLQKLIGAYDADYPIAQREEAGTNAPTEV